MASGLAGMSSREVSEWLAFTSREPIGPRRLDYLAAMIIAAIYNVHRDAKRHPQPFGVDKFLPDWWRDEERQRTVDELSLEEQRTQLQMWATVFGGEFSGG